MSNIVKIDNYRVSCEKPYWTDEDVLNASCLGIVFNEERGSYIIDVRTVSKKATMFFLRSAFPAIIESPSYEVYRGKIFADFKAMYQQVFDDYMMYYHPKTKYTRDLFLHQKETLAHSINKQHNLWALDMGLGKTITSATMSKITESRRTIIISPTLVKWNWFEDMTRFWGYNPMYWTILDANKSKCIKAFEERFVVLNFEMVSKFRDYLLRDEINHIIIDECFPYDTMVETNIGPLKIGYIVENKINCSVWSCDFLTNELSLQKVEYFNVKNREHEYVRIKHESGELVCTSNHKIHVEGKGYLKAVSIRSGDSLRILQKDSCNSKEGEKYSKILFRNLRSARKTIKSRVFRKAKNSSSENINGEQSELRLSSMWKQFRENKIFKKTFLFNFLFGKMENERSYSKSKGTHRGVEEKNVSIIERDVQGTTSLENDDIRTNESEQSCTHGRSIRKDSSEASREKIQRTWWKRKVYSSSVESSRANRFDSGVCSQYERCQIESEGNTESFQIGFSASNFKAFCRNRWKRAFTSKKERTVPAQNPSFRIVRVDSIEVLESASGQRFANMRGEDRVYNIQVATNRNYFANGVLVSNCHYIKNITSQRGKAVLDLISHAPKARLTMLSGTPITNRINDMFSYLKLSHHPLGESKTKFEEKYTIKVGRSKVVGAKNLSDLRGKTSNLMIRLKSEDCIDLPPMIITNYFFEHNELNEEYQLELDHLREKKLKYDSLHGSEKTKMNNEIKNNIHTLNRLAATSKVNQVKLLIDSLVEEGEKVIVFSGYKDPINNLEKIYGNKCVKIDGSVNPHKRQELINRFRQKDDCNIFLANMKAGGIGINLVEARWIINMNFPFTPEQIEQAQKRAHRPGQKRTVYVANTIAKGTIDEHIFELLSNKAEDINELIDDGNKAVIRYGNLPGELFKKLLEN